MNKDRTTIGNSAYSWKAINSEHVALFLITLLALILRIWNIDFHLPQTYIGIEHPEVERALELGLGKFNFGRILKGGLFYLLFVEYGILYVILRALGLVQSTHDFALYFLEDPSLFWIIGRLTSVFMGTVSVVLVYLLGKKVDGYRTGLLASFFFALNPVHIEYSHYICVDIPMTLFVIASLYSMTFIPERGDLKFYFITGLFIGIATLNKFPAIVLILPFLYSHYMRIKKEQSEAPRWLDKRLVSGMLVFTGIYVIGAPGLLVYPKFILNIVRTVVQGRPVGTEGPYSGNTPNLWLVHLGHLYESLGFPLFAFFIWGVIRATYKSSVNETCIALFCLIFYIGVCTSGFPEWGRHYVLPIFPLGLILSAKSVLLLGDFSMRAKPFKSLGRPAIVLLTLLHLVTLALDKVDKVDQPNTRSMAKEWIEQNIDPGSKILLYGFPGIPYSRIVQIHDLPSNLLRLSEEAEKEGKATKAKFFRMQASIKRDIAYDLVAVHTRRIIWQSPEDYRKQKVEYIVLNKKYFDGILDIQYSEKRNESRRRFYKQLIADPAVTLLKAFDSEKLGAEGPQFEIYRISG